MTNFKTKATSKWERFCQEVLFSVFIGDAYTHKNIEDIFLLPSFVLLPWKHICENENLSYGNPHNYVVYDP